MIEFLVAAALAIVIYGGMAFLAIALVRSCVVGASFSGVLTVLTLVVAWLFSMPITGWVIENTLLKSLQWGHAGVAFFGPYILGCFVVFVVFVVASKRGHSQVPPNPSVEPDVK